MSFSSNQNQDRAGALCRSFRFRQKRSKTDAKTHDFGLSSVCRMMLTDTDTLQSEHTPLSMNRHTEEYLSSSSLSVTRVSFISSSFHPSCSDISSLFLRFCQRTRRPHEDHTKTPPPDGGRWHETAFIGDILLEGQQHTSHTERFQKYKLSCVWPAVFMQFALVLGKLLT